MMFSNKKADNYTYLVALAVFGAVVVVGIAGYFGYFWYKANTEQAAYKDLTEHIAEYDKKVSSNEINDLKDLEDAFNAGAKRYNSSNLYPYFLAYQADALVHQNKKKEAIDTLSLALKSLDKTNFMYYLYASKLALIKTDFNNNSYNYKDINKEGIEELKKLAQDANNPIQDMALYYLGLIELNQNNKKGAKEFWSKIVNSKKDSNSSWYSQAKVNLENI